MVARSSSRLLAPIPIEIELVHFYRLHYLKKYILPILTNKGVQIEFSRIIKYNADAGVVYEISNLQSSRKLLIVL